ncbi:unnamed protein product [Chrysoparadoxa australica]
MGKKNRQKKEKASTLASSEASPVLRMDPINSPLSVLYDISSQEAMIRSLQQKPNLITDNLRTRALRPLRGVAGELSHPKLDLEQLERDCASVPFLREVAEVFSLPRDPASHDRRNIPLPAPEKLGLVHYLKDGIMCLGHRYADRNCNRILTSLTTVTLAWLLRDALTCKLVCTEGLVSEMARVVLQAPKPESLGQELALTIFYTGIGVLKNCSGVSESLPHKGQQCSSISSSSQRLASEVRELLQALFALSPYLGTQHLPELVLTRCKDIKQLPRELRVRGGLRAALEAALADTEARLAQKEVPEDEAETTQVVEEPAPLPEPVAGSGSELGMVLGQDLGGKAPAAAAGAAGLVPWGVADVRRLQGLREHLIALRDHVDAPQSGLEGEHHCANDLCNGSELDDFLRCSRCKTTWYCSKECQKLDWRIHKKHCKESVSG